MAACTVANESPDGGASTSSGASASSGASTGAGASETGAGPGGESPDESSESSESGTTGGVAPPSANQCTAAEPDLEPTTSTAGSPEETTGFVPEDEPPPPDPNHETWCGGCTKESWHDDDWSDALANYDPAAFSPTVCAWPGGEPPDTPVPGLVDARIVRNGALPDPSPFVPDNARWIVLGNVELGCDPFAVPLCEHQWRIAIPMHVYSYCELRVESVFSGHGFSLLREDPFMIDVGDANCQTTTFVIADEQSFGHAEFAAQGDLLPDAPLAGKISALCPVPGVSDEFRGSFVADVCPG